MNRKRAIITLATGSQYYKRMALALMISAYNFGGKRYEYYIFSDQDYLPYFEKPEWLNVIKLSDRYYENRDGKTSKGEGFRLKSMILSDPAIQTCDALFLDADCYVFEDCFDALFQLIERNSVAIYGSYSPKGKLWGKLDFPGVAAKAGFKVRNMWLNSGFIGRAADEMGFFFIQQYETLMKTYPFRPFIESTFWQNADEPYLAAAIQIAFQNKYGTLPDQLPSPSSDLYITTYDAKLNFNDPSRPVVTSNYVNGTFKPAIIHFLGGIDMPFYRSLINKTVSFKFEGVIMRPFFTGKYALKKFKYYYKRLTDRSITESRDI